MRSLIFTLALLRLAVPLQAAQESEVQVVPYVVSYLGIPLLDMVQTIETTDSLVTIHYDNRLRRFFAAIMNLHNVYHVTFRAGNFEPLRWSKEIQENDLKFELFARHVPGTNRVRYADGTTRPFKSGTFTVFSATHYLEHMASETDHFPMRLKIYVDGEQWTALVNRYAGPENSQLEDHPPGTVLLRAVLHRVGGKSVVPRNDILTTHIASEGSMFLLWVNASGKIVRARFGRFPTAVELDLLKN